MPSEMGTDSVEPLGCSRVFASPWREMGAIRMSEESWRMRVQTRETSERLPLSRWELVVWHLMETLEVVTAG